jgi:DNA-binding MarR family transcriptional regulator
VSTDDGGTEQRASRYFGRVPGNELRSSEVDYLTLDHQMCFALSVASRSVISLYRPLLEPLGLTHPQYLVMVALWQNEPVSVKGLSQLLQLDPPSVSPVLKRLEGAGLIERHRNAVDERSVRITLTEAGRALKERASDIPEALMARLGMTLDELETLHTSLVKLTSRAQTFEGED